MKLNDEEKEKHAEASKSKKEKRKSRKINNTETLENKSVPSNINTTPSVTPTIRDIMSANSSIATHLPPGTYTDQNGRQIIINTCRKIRINIIDMEDHENMFLIYYGSNTDISVSGMKLL